MSNILYVSSHVGNRKVHNEEAIRYARLTIGSSGSGVCSKIRVQDTNGDIETDWDMEPIPIHLQPS